MRKCNNSDWRDKLECCDMNVIKPCDHDCNCTRGCGHVCCISGPTGPTGATGVTVQQGPQAREALLVPQALPDLLVPPALLAPPAPPEL